MKTKLFLSAALSVGFIASGSAFAQQYPQHYPQMRDGHMDQRMMDPSAMPRGVVATSPVVIRDGRTVSYIQQAPVIIRKDVRNDRHDDRRDRRVVHRWERAPMPVVFAPSGYGPRGDWHRGGRIDRIYQNDRYVIRDYQRYQLGEPPRGYRWLNVGRDYVLAALATDIILDIVRH